MPSHRFLLACVSFSAKYEKKPEARKPKAVTANNSSAKCLTCLTPSATRINPKRVKHVPTFNVDWLKIWEWIVSNIFDFGLLDVRGNGLPQFGHDKAAKEHSWLQSGQEKRLGFVISRSNQGPCRIIIPIIAHVPRLSNCATNLFAMKLQS
jgi:hypothetical protein